MEQTLQDTLEGADETVQQQPPSTRPEKSLQEKLYDTYVEECEKEPEAEGLRSNVNLLEKLMKREPLPCLVVSLYPENQGYSLMLKDKDGVLIEPYPGPYVGQKLLEYLDAEELPSFLIDILEKSPVNVFHSGCVIAEIRDYRECGDIYPPEEPAAEAAVSYPACQVRHILLRPTMQSLVSDVESMTSDSSQWTQEEKQELESQLTSATAEPLCLDPSVAVTCTANKLLFNEQKMNTNPMRQCFKMHACPSLDQEEVPSGCSCPPDLTTTTPCKKQAKISPDNPSDLQIDGTETCNQSLCGLTVPSEMDLENFIKKMLSLPFDETEPTVSAIPEVKHDCMFDCEDDSQLWDMNADIMECLNTLFNDKMEPLPEGSSANPMSLPPVALGDYSDDFLTGINTEPRKTVPMCQETVQSQASCPSKMPQGSSSSVCPPQPAPEKKWSCSSVCPQPAPEKKWSCSSVCPQPAPGKKWSCSSVCPPPTPEKKRPSSSVCPQPTPEKKWSCSSVCPQPTPEKKRPSSSVCPPPTPEKKWPSSSVCPPPTPKKKRPSSSDWPQPAPGKKPTASLVLKKESKIPLLVSLAPISRQGPSSLRSVTPVARRDPPPAPQAVRMVRQTTLGMSRVKIVPRAGQPSARSSENNPTIQPRTLTTRVNLIHLVRSTLVGNSTQVPVRPTSAPAAEGTSHNSHIPTREPRPAQHTMRPPVRLIINNTANPVSVRIPNGSLMLHPDSRSSQRQLQFRQQTYVLIPKQRQPPSAPVPQQPQPGPAASSQGSNPQQVSLPAQQTSRLNSEGPRVVQQTQRSVVCPVSSTPQSQRQIVRVRGFQVTATLVQQGQRQRQGQTQNVRVRVIPRIVPASRADIRSSARGNAASGNAASGNAASGNAASGNAASGNAASGNAASGNAASEPSDRGTGGQPNPPRS